MHKLIKRIFFYKYYKMVVITKNPTKEQKKKYIRTESEIIKKNGI